MRLCRLKLTVPSELPSEAVLVAVSHQELRRTSFEGSRQAAADGYGPFSDVTESVGRRGLPSDCSP